MAIFGKKQAVATTTTTTETPPAATTQVDSSAIGTAVATAVVAALQPLFASRSFAPPAATEPQTEEEPLDPEEEKKIRRVAAQTFQEGAGRYANAFNAAMPEMVRDHVVNRLSEWDQVVYNRHKDEVDDVLKQAVGSDMSALANPKYHLFAIQKVLGTHTDEIAQLQVERLQVDDLPTHLRPPNATTNGLPQGEPLSPLEQNSVDYFNASSSAGKRNQWNAENLRYYKNIKPGYLHEMIAEHKAKKQQEGATT